MYDLQSPASDRAPMTDTSWRGRLTCRWLTRIRDSQHPAERRRAPARPGRRCREFQVQVAATRTPSRPPAGRQPADGPAGAALARRHGPGRRLLDIESSARDGPAGSRPGPDPGSVRIRRSTGSESMAGPYRNTRTWPGEPQRHRRRPGGGLQARPDARHFHRRRTDPRPTRSCAGPGRGPCRLTKCC